MLIRRGERALERPVVSAPRVEEKSSAQVA